MSILIGVVLWFGLGVSASTVGRRWLKSDDNYEEAMLYKRNRRMMRSALLALLFLGPVSWWMLLKAKREYQKVIEGQS